MFKSLATPRFGNLGLRFLAIALDVFIVSAIYGLLVGIVSGDVTKIFSRFGVSTGNVQVDLIVAVVIFIAYFSLLQGFWNGQTIGMKMANLKVMNKEKKVATFPQIILRNVIFLVTTFFSLGLTVVINYILLVFTAKQNTIHDMLSQTYIISTRNV